MRLEVLKAMNAARRERRAGAVVTRLAERFGQLVHGDHQGIGRRAADIVALQGHRAGQHDIGVPRRGGPGDLVHHQRLDFRKGAPQAVEILVVMKRIAARPIDQADVGIAVLASVVDEALGGVQQHVGDA